jgi:hypothetical protein
MESAMNEQELVEAFGKRIGLPGLSLGDEQCCAVTFDQDEVIIDHENNHLFLFSELGSATGHENLYTTMLEANHLGQSSGFGSIGLDPERGSFTLTRVLVGPYDVKLFTEQVSLFVKNVRYWKRYLTEN